MGSVSSSFMTAVTGWRNESPDLYVHITKAVAAEVLYPIIGLAALVEIVAAEVFLLLSLVLSFCSNDSRPVERVADWVVSSAFTVVWAAGATCANFFVARLPEQEDAARSYCPCC